MSSEARASAEARRGGRRRRARAQGGKPPPPIDQSFGARQRAPLLSTSNLGHHHHAGRRLRRRRGLPIGSSGPGGGRPLGAPRLVLLFFRDPRFAAPPPAVPRDARAPGHQPQARARAPEVAPHRARRPRASHGGPADGAAARRRRRPPPLVLAARRATRRQPARRPRRALGLCARCLATARGPGVRAAGL